MRCRPKFHVALRTTGSRFGAGGCKLMSAALTTCPNLVELEMSRASVPVAVCLAVVSQPALTCVRCAAVRLVQACGSGTKGQSCFRLGLERAHRCRVWY